MTSDNDNQRAKSPATQSGHRAKSPATHSGAPNRELEIKVKQNPDDEDAKVDLGSDESMDASDPSAATQPSSPDPAPSSTYPEEKPGA